jgi:hypothetical protein
MSTKSWAENIAHSAMYTYKGGEQNFSPGTSVRKRLIQSAAAKGNPFLILISLPYISDGGLS